MPGTVTQRLDRVQSVGVPTTRFVTTAMPKSGSNWFEALLFSLPGVGGYGERVDGALLLTLSHLLATPELPALLASSGMTLSSALVRILQPDLAPGDPLPESARAEARRILPALRMRLPARAGLLARDQQRRPTLERLVEPLFAPRGGEPGESVTLAVGCPSKHEPASKLLELLPGFRILQLIRDPRDVLVSRFYHDLAHVSPGMIALFARRVRGGALEHRDDWMSAYFAARRDELLAYYADFSDPRLTAETRTLVRYEELLVDAPGVLAGVARVLGVEPSLRDAAFDFAAHCRRFAFESVTAGDAAQVDRATGERRNSFLRSGKSGDWRNYFDRALTDVLGPRFAELLIELGYEPDHRWLDAVPHAAPRSWDFSRLRARQSLVRTFRPLWESDPALQERFPNPTDLLAADGGFLGHIIAAGHPAVLAHRADLIALARLWNADTRETVQF